ncbi:DUF4974 domain-containing protein [Puteibacter caeruleilacunae]|nr:DUF4974 domain-containing protein [Puteibacter caeruleilacunae]
MDKDTINKLVKGTLTELEKEQFHSRFIDTKSEFEVKNALLQQLEEGDFAHEEADFEKLFQAVLNRIEENKKPKAKTVSLFSLIKVAAIVVISLLAGIMSYHFLGGKHGEMATVIAAVDGSVSHATLPDGTNLYLNSGAKLSYDPASWKKERVVTLNGEAWFEVDSDPKHPFIVKTGFYDVKVTGTKFNVKAYADDRDIITTLEEGIVTILSGDKVQLQQEIRLNPGEQLVYNQYEQKIRVSKVAAHMYGSWKERKLIFVNANMKEVIRDIERKYGLKIEVKDQEILQYHYDFTIEHESIIDVLNMLSETLPIKYSIKNQVIIIEKRK